MSALSWSNVGAIWDGNVKDMIPLKIIKYDKASTLDMTGHHRKINLQIAPAAFTNRKVGLIMKLDCQQNKGMTCPDFSSQHLRSSSFHVTTANKRICSNYTGSDLHCKNCTQSTSPLSWVTSKTVKHCDDDWYCYIMEKERLLPLSI